MNEHEKSEKSGFKSKKVKEIIFVSQALAYPLLLFLIFYIYVNINSFVMAFQELKVDGTKIWVGFRNFKTFIDGIFSDSNILGTAFSNTVKMYVINLVICVPSYILFAYLLFRKCFGNTLIRILVMIPQVVSSMVITLVFKKFIDNAFPEMMKQIFHLSKFPSLLNETKYMFGTTLFYMIWTSYAVSVIMYSNAMNAIPDEVLESACLDGCDTMFRELWYIIIPLIWPTLTTVLVTGFAGFMAQAGPIMAFYYDSAPAAVYNIGYWYNLQVMKSNELNYGIMSAGGLLMTLFIAPLTYLLRHLLEKVYPED